ncbi:C2H2 type zinc-finger-domain-containing protein [Gaertneriomyces semiglobifer]|nr:C2H2 type zinc-finger-domain-containing protein [Gaertneriomyces semiglobifer]
MDVEARSVTSETASDFSDLSHLSTATGATGPSTMASSTTPRSHLFTCLACHVAFRSAEHQREHMRSDWHRYNLKRKVAELPPVSAEAFAEKLTSQKRTTVDEEKKASYAGECQACGKSYSTENAFENHKASRKHKEQQARFDLMREKGIQPQKSSSTDQQETSAEAQSTNWRQALASATSEAEYNEILDKKLASLPRLTEVQCLFCTASADTFESNLEHMAKAHSFFIPDVEYLVDIKGLIKYLGEKVAVGHVCLSCNGKGKGYHSLEAVRKHMVDKGHCKIAYEDGAELEVSDFYDFSSTYPDEKDDDWEDVDGEEISAADADDVQSMDDDDEDELPPATPVAINESGTELILPNGRSIGHRHLNHVWRQNVRPAVAKDSTVINRLMGQYRLLGYEPTPYEIAQQHHERRIQAKKQMRTEHEFKSRVGQRANKLQKHFRSQIGFGV